ncbi:MAG TPA: hypothetical protein VMI56_06545, partial [Reyranella sp.]|nr:hypothetical protein [Reyranella sp.]
MYLFDLGFIDNVMNIVRRRESSYGVWADNPPDPRGVLFGLSAGQNALAPQPPRTNFVGDSYLVDQKDILGIIANPIS